MLMHQIYKLLNLKYETRRIKYNKKTLSVYIADSFFKSMFGLMFRESLDEGRGMLFTLGRESRSEASIWMLNMKFSIDILWLDRDGKVIDIKENASPCTSVWGCEHSCRVRRPSMYSSSRRAWQTSWE